MANLVSPDILSERQVARYASWPPLPQGPHGPKEESTMKRFALLTLTAVFLLTFITPSAATPQTPPEEQNPWLCYDIVGWERPCTITEEWERCKRAAEDARLQCEQNAGDNLFELIICGSRFVADEKACDAAFLGHFWFF